MEWVTVINGNKEIPGLRFKESELIQDINNLPMPLHLRNAPTKLLNFSCRILINEEFTIAGKESLTARKNHPYFLLL